jgi:hypothetical protein
MASSLNQRKKDLFCTPQRSTCEMLQQESLRLRRQDATVSIARWSKQNPIYLQVSLMAVMPMLEYSAPSSATTGADEPKPRVRAWRAINF